MHSIAVRPDVTRGTTWNRRFAAVVAAALLAVPMGSAGAAPATTGLVEVVVTRAAGVAGAAERAVVAAGGEIVRRIDLIDGFTALLPGSEVGRLSVTPGVGGVAANRAVQLESRRMTGDALRGTSSLDHVRRAVGADFADLLGADGSNVGVAVLDTGVANVNGLQGNVLHGPDLSPESPTSLAHVDTFGHGTHMASIVGGDTSGFEGVADDARIVSVKVAPADGSTDLFRVLAGLDWVVQHRAAGNVRVLNLSLGVPDPTDYRFDPLAFAVEKVWKAGIVVVVAGGNEGEKPTSPLTSPATDPYVIAVGAADTKGTDSELDDTVAAFSPTGSAARRVDVVAPGQSVLGLRAPGSTIDTNFPSARVGTTLFKGTGTSQAAAVVSGAVADLLSYRPSLTPDQVKALLRSTADPVNGVPADRQGAGMIDLRTALVWPVFGPSTQNHDAATPPPPPAPCPPEAAEHGSTCEPSVGGEWAGGTWDGGTWDGTSWTGGTYSGGTWTGTSWTGTSWTGGTWSNGTWNGTSWTGGEWTGGQWAGTSWTGTSWTGGAWNGTSWTGGTWVGTSWTGTSWTGTSWTGTSWTGTSWTGTSWTGTSWTGTSWTGTSWTGTSWTGSVWAGSRWS